MERKKKEIEFGVYSISFNNQLLYIGSTNDFSKRKSQHIKKLKDGKHIKALQKYADENVSDLNKLEFKLIHVTKDDSPIRLFFAELVLIMIHKPFNKPVIQFGLTKYVQFARPKVDWDVEILKYL